MSNPYESPNFDSPSGSESPGPSSSGAVPSGMVQQVRVIAILNAVQGLLELMMGGLLVFAGVMMLAMEDNPEFQRAMEQQQDPAAAEIMPYMWIGYTVIGALLIASGIFRMIAGFTNWKFRGRIMGIASMVVGLVSVIGCYCAPTSLAVLVYGMIVYLNPSVAQAFQMGSEGVPGDRILFEFSPYRQQV